MLKYEKLTMKLDPVKDNPGRFWTRSEKKLWLSGLFFGCVTLYMSRVVMPLCAVSVAKELDWKKTDTGTVLSAFFWGYAMTQILGGYMSDRVGGEVVITVCGVFWSLMTFWTPRLVYISSNKETVLTVLTISRVLMGCFQGVHFPAVTSLIAKKVSEEEKAFSYGCATSGSHFGALLTGCLGSLLLESYGWHMPFYTIGLLSMVWVLLMRYVLIAQDRRKTQILSLKEDISPQHNTIQTEKVPWLKILSKSAFWAILITHFCKNWAYFVLLSWIPTYFHDNFPDAKGWVFNVVPWSVSLPSVLFGGWLADTLIAKGYSVTFTRKLIQSICLIGLTIFMIAITLVESYFSSLLCIALSVGCTGFHVSGVLVNPTDIAPKYSGSVFGIMNTAGAIPGFVGVYIAGHILEVTKSWSAVFLQTAAISFIGWIVFMIFGTGKKII